ncbi:carbohydrate sulfotransferase 11 isoform X2 [Cimex lectularius]|uniref:Carbohydrate sulfotransferase n=1 Tax=Cimex lectularius TaxID=79782 RepID=A0A8I6THJ4_CIMLE|nr:carbohydrate sulfotransferase 11 isoform X2 [Cimex lectularius]
MTPKQIFTRSGSQAAVKALTRKKVLQEKKVFESYDKSLKEEIAARMFYRKQKMKEACARYGLDKSGNDSLHKPNPWEFLINKKYHIVWCNIFKAASTSWMYNFNVLAGYRANFLKRTNIVPLQLARRRYPRPTLAELKAALNNSFSFIIVRHPLERLLSAYRDKIQYALPNTPHQKLGNEIVLKYRKQYENGVKKDLSHQPRWPTMSEFVNYLVDAKRKGEPLDMHWAPMTEFCTPCQISFDIIIKFETLQEDQKYLIELVGVQDKIKPEWKNPSKGKVTAEVLYSYYSQLTVTQILQLYNIYRYDFELFEYNIQEYVEMAKAGDG